MIKILAFLLGGEEEQKTDDWKRLVRAAERAARGARLRPADSANDPVCLRVGAFPSASESGWVFV